MMRESFPKQASEAEGLTEEQMLREQAADVAQELLDLSVSSDPSLLASAVPQVIAGMKRSLAFLDLSDETVRQAVLDAVVDAELEPQLAAGTPNLDVHAHTEAVIVALRAWKPNGKKAA